MSQLFSVLMNFIVPLPFIMSPDLLIEWNQACCGVWLSHAIATLASRVKKLVVRMQHSHYLHFRELALD